jgi:hypothetical protein
MFDCRSYQLPVRLRGVATQKTTKDVFVSTFDTAMGTRNKDN